MISSTYWEKHNSQHILGKNMIGSTFWKENIIGSKFCGKSMIGSTFWEKT
jgi:hypothetical protein